MIRDVAPVEFSEILTLLRSGLSNVLGNQTVSVYLYGSRARGDYKIVLDNCYKKSPILLMDGQDVYKNG